MTLFFAEKCVIRALNKYAVKTAKHFRDIPSLYQCWLCLTSPFKLFYWRLAMCGFCFAFFLHSAVPVWPFQDSLTLWLSTFCLMSMKCWVKHNYSPATHRANGSSQTKVLSRFFFQVFSWFSQLFFFSSNDFFHDEISYRQFSHEYRLTYYKCKSLIICIYNIWQVLMYVNPGNISNEHTLIKP